MFRKDDMVMKSVYDVISTLRVMNYKDRLFKLRNLGSPDIILNNLESDILIWESGKGKVAGMSRKYPISERIVKELGQAEVIGDYFKYGKQKTLILRMVLDNDDVFYYDYYANKIGKPSDLEVNIYGIGFRCAKFEEDVLI